MAQKQLGQTNIMLNQIGLGCMGLSEFYGPPTEESAAIKLLHEAIDLGVNHFDTAEAYGVGRNESLLGRAFNDRRDKVRIATKFGFLRDPDTGAPLGLDGSPENCRKAAEGSLRRLQTDHIDLYYLHRVDPNTPIEETVTEMAKLVAEGKVGALGLSEVSGETLRRAQAIHPITAVQSEYSIFSREIEQDGLPVCKETGTSLVAYSPLGRGMLTGSFKQDSQISETDFRGTSQPRFSGDAYAANLQLVDTILSLAAALDVSAAEVALAWVIAKQDNVLPIAGTTKLANLKTNLAAMELTLSPEAIASLDDLADRVEGTRYNEQGMTIVNA